jgi:hypothetical protein
LATPAPLAPSSPPAIAVEPPPPPPPAPLTMVETGEFRAHPSGAKMTLFERGALGASFAPDRSRVLVVPGGRGARLKILPSGPVVKLEAGHVQRASFSPDSKFVALEIEDGNFRVFSADGKLVAEHRGRDARFVAPGRLGFRTGCEGFALDVASGGKPRRVGKACGTLLHSSADFASWIIAEPGRFRMGVLQTYERAKRIEFSANRESILIQGGGDAVFLEPVVSPSGDRLCFLQSDFGLYCSTLSGKADAQRVWPSSVLRGPSFDDGGRRLVFGVGRNEHSPRDVHVADFQTQSVKKVVHATHEWWTFLPGGERLVGHGGDEKLTVYDLSKSLKIELGHAREEWEGLSPVPGDASRFVIGRERGGSRDLWLVELPP